MATYTIKGSTSENAVPKNNLIVAYKANRADPETIGQELGRATAAGNGVWEISFEDWEHNVFVVALDPTTAIKYKAKIKDWVLGTLYVDPQAGNYPELEDEFFDNVVTLYHFEEADVPSLINEAKPTASVDIDFFNSPSVGAVNPKVGLKRLNFETGSHAEIRTHISSGNTWSDVGAVDCTLEGWFYMNGTAGALFTQGASGAGSSTGSAPLEKNGLQILVQADGQIKVLAGNLGSYGAASYFHMVTAVAAIPFNQWVHFAFVVASQVPKIYVDGVNKPLTIFNGTYPNTDFTTCHMWNTVPFNLNAINWDNGTPSNGQKVEYSVVHNSTDAMDEVRITLGTARYLTDFTPSTEPFNRFAVGKEATILDPYWDYNLAVLNMDNDGSSLFREEVSNEDYTALGAATQSSAVVKYGEASGRFEFAPDQFLIPYDSSFDIGDELFTIECWVYRTGSHPSYPAFISLSDLTGTNAVRWTLGMSPSNQLDFNIYTGSVWLDPIAPSGSIPDTTWTHVAVVRDSTAATGIKTYIGGNLVATSTSNPSLDTNASPMQGFAVGGRDASALNAYVDDVRVTKGYARYTGNFTPPTSAIPPFEYDPFEILVSYYPFELDPYADDVVSLLHFEGIDGSTNIYDESRISWETLGTAQLDTATPYFGDSSLVLNGSSDYITQGAAADWTFLHAMTSNWTIEFWVYPTSVTTAYECLVDTGGASSAGRGISIVIRGDTDSKLELAMAKNTGGSYSLVLTSTNTMVAGNYSHVTVMHKDGTMYLFINGSPQGSADPVSPHQSAPLNALQIGRWASGNIYYADVSIDDFRITKTARYPTTGFSMPTSAFPDTRFQVGKEATILDPDFDSVISMLDFNGNLDDVRSENAWSLLQGSVSYVSELPYFQNREIDMSVGSALIQVSAGFDLSPIGTGDFSVEIVLNEAVSTGTFCNYWDWRDGGSQGLALVRVNGEGRLKIYNNVSPILTGTTDVLTDGGPHFVQVVRESGVLYLYVDGVDNGSVAYTVNLTASVLLSIGGTYTNAQYTNCKFSNFRFSTVARVTAAYTPLPDTAFPILAYDPLEALPAYLTTDSKFDQVSLLLALDGEENGIIFEDSSENSLTVTKTGTPTTQPHFSQFGASACLFNGTTDYLRVPYSAELFLIQSRPLTIEAWVYPTGSGASSEAAIFVTRDAATPNGGVTCYLWNGSIAFSAWNSGSTTITMNGTIPILVNQWAHMCWERDPYGNWYMYTNGVLDLSGSESGLIGTPTSSPKVTIGAQSHDGLRKYEGYINDLRVTMGQNRYGGAFTPPSDSLPRGRFLNDNVPTYLHEEYPYVEVLLSHDGVEGVTDIVDSSKNNLTPVYIAPVEYDSSQLHFGRNTMVADGAMKFSGLEFGNGFTMEMFIRITDYDNTQYFMGNVSGAAGSDFLLYHDRNLAVDTFRFNLTGVDRFTFASPAINTWHHIAITYDGVNFQVYLNGSSQGTFAHVAPSFDPDLYVAGRYDDVSQVYNIVGNFSNFRYTEGKVLYTGASHTVPTEYFKSKQYEPYVIAPVLTPEQATVKHGPTGYWKVSNEDSATAVMDRSGYHDHAPLVGAATEWQIIPGIVTSDLGGKAIRRVSGDLTGAGLEIRGDYIEEQTAFTVMGYIKITSESADGYWISNGTTGTLFPSFAIEAIVATNTFALYKSATTDNTGALDETGPADLWVLDTTLHLAVTWDNAGDQTLKVYINGILSWVTAAHAGVCFTKGSKNFQVGGGTPDSVLPCDSGDIAVYDTALSASAIAEIAAAGEG